MSAAPVQATAAAHAPAWTRSQQLCFAACGLPAAWMAAAAVLGALGANPLETLLAVSGRAGLWLLLLTLSVGPLLQLGSRLAQRAHWRHGRRLSDWNGLILLRRQLGLYACFYSVLHLALYAVLDAGLDTRELLDDLLQHAYMPPGWLALLALLPLAATSSQAARRWLGPWWQRLHLLGYVAGACGVLHMALQAKVTLLLPWFEMLLLAALVAWRVHESLRGRPERLKPVRRRLRRWRGQGEPPA